MRRILLIPLLLGLAAPALAQPQPQSLGIYAEWGSFTQDNPRRCYAIAGPHRSPRPRAWRPFASVSYWPQRGVRGQLHIRLSRAKRPGSAVILRVDDRSFQLIGGGNNAWAPNARADAEIVATIRRGLEMSVETRSTTGGRVRDQYRLRGAATAIDAAAIACAR
jgi:hypothetical protein